MVEETLVITNILDKFSSMFAVQFLLYQFLFYNFFYNTEQLQFLTQQGGKNGKKSWK